MLRNLLRKITENFEKSRILASQTLPQTLPKSAAPPLRCLGVSEQLDGNYCCKYYAVYRVGVRRLGGPSLLNFRRSMGAMLAPFFDLGCFLSAFCVSCCVCCRPWPVFERLEALRRRFRSLRAGFWRVSRGRGVVFGAPGVHFSALLQACTLILGKSFQCVKTIVFPRFFQVFHISRAFCAH